MPVRGGRTIPAKPVSVSRFHLGGGWGAWGAPAANSGQGEKNPSPKARNRVSRVFSTCGGPYHKFKEI